MLTTWQVWKNCRTYNEAPHKILELCEETQALLEAEWAREGVEESKAPRLGKKRKVPDAADETAQPKAADSGSHSEKTMMPASEASKKLRITMRSSTGWTLPRLARLCVRSTCIKIRHAVRLQAIWLHDTAYSQDSLRNNHFSTRARTQST